MSIFVTGVVKFDDKAITNNADAEEDTKNSSIEIHYLPFKIQHDGQIENVDKKFTSKICKEKDSNVLQSYFRGRSLQGDIIHVKDYEGICALEHTEKLPPVSILGTDNENIDSKKDKTLNITSKFNQFTYWNFDQLPTKMDAPVKLLDWLELSQILHEPSGLEEAPNPPPGTGADSAEPAEASKSIEVW